MSPQRWRQIQQILEHTFDGSSEDRRAWIAEQCRDDAELLAEVEEFLAYEDRLEGFIDTPLLPPLLAPSPLDAIEVGQRIGPYRLVRTLGHGGMGVVFLAEREEEFEQQVALKVVRHGGEVTERFQTERQLLARLEHPNIARLLDGGTTDDGVPYFAMEHVEGERLDKYCDRNRLTVRQRLELLLPICAALQLAHQNLIVHRDLKPSNILVDQHGIPKLLDFGIAKLLQTEHQAGSAGELRRSAMTLLYSSPEQRVGEPVNTTSDVYSLGAVLYQLLTGRLPHHAGIEEGSAIASDSPPDLAGERPPRPMPPSRAVERDLILLYPGGERLELTLEAVASERSTSAPALRRTLKGDVDAIVLKALEPRPEDRYATIEQLASDIRQHLEQRPVVARNGGPLYVAGRFWLRHKIPVAALLLAVMLGIGFTLALDRQLLQTERARQLTDEIFGLLVEFVQTSSPDNPVGAGPTADDLEDFRRRFEHDLQHDPATLSRLQLRLGEVYILRGEYDQAIELIRNAVSVYRDVGPEAQSDLATALNNLAVIHYQHGKLDAAEELFREAIELRTRAGSTENLLKPRNNLAAILLERGAYTEAEAIYRQTLEQRRRQAAVDPSEDRRANLATSLRSLANVLLRRHDLEEAAPLLQEALDIRRAIYGPDSPSVADVLVSQGRLHHIRGDLTRARSLYARALDIRQRRLGEAHLETALVRRDLGAVILDQGIADEAARQLAVGHLETSLAQLRQRRASGNRDVLETEALLAAARIEIAPDPAAHVDELRRTLEVLEAQFEHTSFFLRQLRLHLARRQPG